MPKLHKIVTFIPHTLSVIHGLGIDSSTCAPVPTTNDGSELH